MPMHFSIFTEESQATDERGAEDPADSSLRKMFPYSICFLLFTG